MLNSMHKREMAFVSTTEDISLTIKTESFLSLSMLKQTSKRLLLVFPPSTFQFVASFHAFFKSKVL